MNLKIDGKTALVTGSTGGIGLAIAKALVREGVAVIVNGRTQARVDAAIAEVRKEAAGATVKGVAADLGSSEGVRIVTDAFPDVDILVNNVGVFEPKPFVEINDESWQRHFDVNVMSGVRFSRHYFPKMIAQNWGRIVFISSESALQIPAEMIQYGMTKTAQLAVARGLAESASGTNVTVNSVLPGPTFSEGVAAFVGNLAASENVSEDEFSKRFFHDARPSSIIQRFATTDEVASMVAYVCSELASATTGAALRVDGGVVRSIA
jgi:NAD(P)-dependent dehydrogenase (short-subunit alcohol dehydrogenase family)